MICFLKYFPAIIMKKRRYIKGFILIFTVFFAVLTAVCVFRIRSRNRSSEEVREDFISNPDEIVAAIRTGMRDHASQIEFRFHYRKNVSESLPGMFEEWIGLALEETDSPVEGDYIRYQSGGYEITCDCEAENGAYAYLVTVIPQYYMYYSQEITVTEELEKIMNNFGFDENTSDYEKICTVYDYVCTNIKYDNVHKGNPYHYLRSTSYAGIIWKSATCQGYCVTLYRMLKEMGIDCRIVTGTVEQNGRSELHAWNIVRLDGAYYAVDATWDAGKEEYQYFLKGKNDFSDHFPEDKFLTREFEERYPMADAAYRGR